MSAPNAVRVYGGVDLDYRPATYVADWCATAAVVQNIAGEVRREIVHLSLAAGALRAPMPAWFMADVLSPRRRDALVARDPVALAPGEYLPPCARGELEVARVVVATLPRLVYSLRAVVARVTGAGSMNSQPLAEPVMQYRLVGDGGRAAQLQHEHSRGTLPLRDVVQLLDTARLPGLDDGPGAPPARWPLAERLLFWRWEREHDRAALRRFVRVSSAVYPQLSTYYRERLRQWMTTRLALRGERVTYAPPLDRALEMAWGQ
jgi:hypothetical protein